MEKHEVKITTEFIKLEGLLKFSGVAETGGEAKNIIQAGVEVIFFTCVQLPSNK